MLDLYKVGRLMYDLRGPERIAEWKRDSEAVMTRYGLSEEDKEAIRSKNAKVFFDAGLHPLLLGAGARALVFEPIMRTSTGQPPTPGPDLDARKQKAAQIAREFNLVTPLAPQMSGTGNR